ncbi:MAG: hypothetical protein LBD68_05475, partial [Zoogloeaceae bacterium]|nr:hypothetical protein [Zoogloeaceae bacterium]
KKQGKKQKFTVTATPQNQGVFAALGKVLPKKGRDQLLLGLVIGATTAYILGNEETRARLIKTGISLYARLASGLEEIREQFADIQAELGAQAGQDAPAS